MWHLNVWLFLNLIISDGNFSNNLHISCCHNPWALIWSFIIWCRFVMTFVCTLHCNNLMSSATGVIITVLSQCWAVCLFGCTGSLFLCAGFLWLWQAGATLGCGAWASRFGGFSCCGVQALGTWASVVAACRLQSTGSAVAVHRLSWPHSLACRIFPNQELNQCPLHWQVDSQPLNH